MEHNVLSVWLLSSDNIIQLDTSFAVHTHAGKYADMCVVGRSLGSRTGLIIALLSERKLEDVSPRPRCTDTEHLDLESEFFRLVLVFF